MSVNNRQRSGVLLTLKYGTLQATSHTLTVVLCWFFVSGPVQPVPSADQQPS
jgi:hypothetical protein